MVPGATEDVVGDAATTLGVIAAKSLAKAETETEDVESVPYAEQVYRRRVHSSAQSTAGR